MSIKYKNNFFLKPEGFTLLEVLVASIIVLLCSFVIYRFLGDGSSVNRSMVLEKRAYEAAQSLLEKPQFASGDAYLNLATGTFNQGNIVLMRDNLGNATVQATRQMTVSPVQNILLNGISVPSRRITAQVTWTDRNNQQRQIDLSTIVTYR